MAEGLAELKLIRASQRTRLDGTSKGFNTQRIEVPGLDNLMETAYATAVAANFRTEVVGYWPIGRFIFPGVTMSSWLCHSLYHPDTESMTRRAVNMSPPRPVRGVSPPRVRTFDCGSQAQ